MAKKKSKVERRIKLLEWAITALIISIIDLAGMQVGFGLDVYNYLVVAVLVFTNAIVLWLHLDSERE